MLIGRTGCSRFTVLVNSNVNVVLDRRALVRVFDELLWSLRRAGVSVATSQSLDWLRAVDAIGFAEPGDLRAALVALTATERSQVPIVERVFDRFFTGERLRGDLFERLGARGLTAGEVDVVRGLLAEVARAGTDEGAAVSAVVGRGAAFDRLLGLAGARIDAFGTRVARGWLVEQARASVGMRRAKDGLASLRGLLADAFGDARAEEVLALLDAEIQAAEADVKGMVDARRSARAERERAREQRLTTRAFATFTPEERVKVRRAVKLVAEKMAGAERVRSRRAAQGRFDARLTLRAAWRTSGVPVQAVRRRRRPGKPKLFLLCDVSDSVRGASELLLEVVQTAQNAFSGTRSFVFVRDLGEATDLLAREPPDRSRELIAGGSVVPVTENSSYGRVLRLFLERYGRVVDKRTTVVILGDGRTNWVDDGAPTLDAIRARAKALVWLCPEPRSEWSIGDSAMGRFAPKCTEVLEVSSVEALEVAARRLRRLRAR